MLNYKNLKGQVPLVVFDGLLECATKYQINNALRMSHFLSQCAHESTNFQRTVENLNYSAQGLLKVFPKYFDGNSAVLYEHCKEAIASKVYAERMGNGPEDSREGWTYRGRGYLQLTGKENYKQFDLVCEKDVLHDPDLVATEYPLISAAWFWKINGLNQKADLGATDDIIKVVTKKINGGYNGLVDRIDKFHKFHELVKSQKED